jgi:hypothetical protein
MNFTKVNLAGIVSKYLNSLTLLFAFGINNTKYRLLNICFGKNIFNVLENLKLVL